MQSFNSVSLFFAVFFISVFITLTPIHGLDQPIRKLDESPVPGEEKCDLCKPNPPPPVPSPPPPAPVLSPPPPAPVLSPPPPPLGYCPPSAPPSPGTPSAPPSPGTPSAPPSPGTPSAPPSPGTPSPPSSPVNNITSPPGGLYPIDDDFTSGGAVRGAGLPVLIGLGILLVRFGF